MNNERIANMNLALERLTMMVSSCRKSDEKRCSVCPWKLKHYCESFGLSGTGDNGETLSEKIKRHMTGGIPVYYEGQSYTIVSYNYTVMGPMLSRVAGHTRVELLDKNGNSMLNCAPEDIEFEKNEINEAKK